MKKVILSLALLLECRVCGEITPHELNGLDAMMAPVAGRQINNGENKFSPVYGYAALKSGMLERARLYGNYGKINKQIRNMLHDAFLVTNADDPHQFTKQFEYPLDSICALIQWLFPSVDGAVLVANERNADLVGILGDQIKKQESSYFSQILRLIHQYSLNPKSISQFSREISEIIPKMQDGKDIEGQINRFAGILYNSLLQDGTFGKRKLKDGPLHFVHDALYPENTALHALLGYLCRVADNKDQVIAVMEQAGLTNTAISLRSDYTKLDYDHIKDTLSRSATILTRSYPNEHRLSHAIAQSDGYQNLTFEQIVYAGYGYEFYEKSYPEILPYGQAVAPCPEGYGTPNHTYADCGETMLRNFFNLIIFQTGGFLNAELLNCLPDNISNHPKMQEIINFYKRFPTVSLQQSQKARNDWSLIVSDLNAKERHDATSSMDVVYDGYSNIKAYGGIKNILNIMAKLTGDAVLNEEWIDDPKNSHIAKKLTRICQIFSIEAQIDIDWMFADGKESVNNHGFFKFTILKNKEKFTFNMEITQGHFKLTPLLFSPADWRKNIFFGDQKSDLLTSFYGEPRSAFLDPLIAQNPIKTLDFWSSLDRKIPLSLRLIYKIFGAQLDDIYTQISLFRFLNPLRNLGMNQETDPLVVDFAQTLLVQRNGENSWMFAMELGNEEPDERIDIFTASKFGLFNIAKRFLAKKEGMPPQEIYDDVDGFTPLMIAALNGHLSLCQLLIQNGMRIDETEAYIKGKGFTDRRTPLMLASMHGHADVVDFLITQKAKIDHQAFNYKTALWFAAQSGHLNVVELLVRNKANINQLGFSEHMFDADRTPLMWAIEFDYIEMALFLLKNGANINARDSEGTTSLMRIASIGQIRVANFMLDHGADIHAKDKKGMTSLMYAARSGEVNMIDLLYKRGARLEDFGSETVIKRPVQEATPLLFSANYGHMDTFLALLNHGANLDAVDKRGNSALLLAAQEGQTAVVEFLVTEQQIDIEQKNKFGQTALMLAAKSGHISTVAFLIEKKASINDKDTVFMQYGPYDQSALLHAAGNGKKDIVQMLLENGANPTLTNKKGVSDLDVVKSSSRYEEIIQMMSDAAVNFLDNQDN